MAGSSSWTGPWTATVRCGLAAAALHARLPTTPRRVSVRQPPIRSAIMFR